MPRHIARHVLADVSPLIRELATCYWSLAVVRGAPRALVDLCETAHHLSQPVSDYETPARAAGWLPEPGDTLNRVYLDTTARDGEDESYYHAADWQEACSRLSLEPETLPVLEWHSVTEWLCERLAEAGEQVGELAGLFVWARTNAGDIGADETIRAISRSVATTPDRDGDARP
jgi:hypothetical protein